MDCVDCGFQHSDMAEHCPKCGRPVSISQTLPANNLIGEVLEGKYCVEERVNQGGMAFLYKGTDTQLGLQVALKVLYPHLAEVPHLKERFCREARLQFTLQHPGIVRVHGLVEDRGVFGMVMDWIDGPDLTGWLAQEKSLSYVEIWELLAPILDAIHVAHEHGVIHRDLKPDNILMLHRRDGWHPLITDFGIAKDTGSETLTQTGAVMGTALYMSPEQARGLKEIDLRSDLYSLGVILFQLLTGSLPFVKDTPTAVMFAHVTEPVPTIRSMGYLVDASLEAFVLRVLAKSPEERPQSAKAFAQTLKPLLLDASQSAPLVCSSSLREEPLPSVDVPLSYQPTMAPTSIPSSKGRLGHWPLVLSVFLLLLGVALGLLFRPFSSRRANKRVVSKATPKVSPLIKLPRRTPPRQVPQVSGDAGPPERRTKRLGPKKGLFD